MTTFDQGNRLMSPMGNGGVLPTLEPTVLPNTPGVEPSPLVESDTQKVLRNLLDSAGYAATIAVGFGNMTQEQIREAERLKAKQDAALEKQRNAIEQADRGLATRQTYADLADIEAKIADGSLAPNPGETTQEFTNRILQIDTADNQFSPEYVDQRLNIGTPAIARAVARRRGEVVQVARSQNHELIVASAQGASPDDIPGVVAALTENDPSISEPIAFKIAASKAITAAAATGDTARFESLKSSMADHLDPLTVQGAQNTLDQFNEAQRRKSEAEALNDLARLENSGLDNESLRSVVSKDPRLDEISRGRVLGMLEGRDKQQLADVQQQGSNNLIRDVRLGRWIDGTPQTTVNEITRRMDLPETDPNFIGATTGTELIRGVGKTLETDVRTSIVGQKLDQAAKGGRVDAPATPQDDQAIIRNLVQRGIVVGQPDGETTVVESVADPVAAAKAYSSLNRLPDPIAKIIAGGVSSQDPAQAQAGLSNYAALYVHNPLLAESIEMPKSAKVRARFVSTAIDSLDLKNASSEVINGVAAKLMPQAMTLNPAAEDIAARDIKAAVYSKDPDLKDFETQIRSDAAKSINDTLTSPVFQEKVGIKSGWWTWDTKGLNTIPQYVVDSYNDAIVDEFRIARSMNRDDEQAAKQAKDYAMRRALAKHVPAAWGNRLTFSLSGEPAFNADSMRSDAASVIGEAEAATLWEQYTPRYDETMGNQPGWMFYRSAYPTSVYRTEDGQPLKLTGSPTTVTTNLADMVTQARANREAFKKIPFIPRTPGT